jgi:peptidoglycan/LPS O-acetylase OafA/YrhL
LTEAEREGRSQVEGARPATVPEITGPAELPGNDLAQRKKLPILDGWRATSILLVLAAHLLPLGPSALQMNHTAGAMGMALFFTLSGFLITRFLAQGMEVSTFLLRRLARIVPLAWLVMLVLAIWNQPKLSELAANFLFYANLPPAKLLHGGEHLWSICVEMQFYALAAALCVIPRRRGLYLIPALCIVVTGLRVAQDAHISIYTWQRVDEILAGGSMALVYLGWAGGRAQRALRYLAFWPALLILMICSHPYSGDLQYVRPYAAAALVGGTLVVSPPKLIEAALVSKLFAYVAEISYALYMIHGVLMNTWLGQGELVERYIKKPFLFLLTFGLAHVSTRYFERPILRIVRNASQDRKATSPALQFASDRMKSE